MLKVKEPFWLQLELKKDIEHKVSVIELDIVGSLV